MADVADVTPGETVTIRDAGGRFVARGVFNPRPALCCRILTWPTSPRRRLLARRIDRRHGGAGPALRRSGGWCGARPTVCPGWWSIATGRCWSCSARPSASGTRDDLVAALRARLGDSRSRQDDPASPAWRASRRCPAGSVGRGRTTSSWTRTACSRRAAGQRPQDRSLSGPGRQPRAGRRRRRAGASWTSSPTPRASPSRSPRRCRRAVCVESSADAAPAPGGTSS